jgi:hypothetical protein
MNVYVENILAKTLRDTLTATNKAAAYSVDMLYDEVLSNAVVFSGPSTKIAASWGLNQFADTVAILDSNWMTGRLAVVSQGETVFDKTITARGKHTIIKLPEMVMVSSISLELNAHEYDKKLKVGILFVGRRIELPLFNVGFKYKLNVNSKGERTRYGIVYGSKKSSLRSFDVTFTDIDNSRRQVMEEYVDTVQYVQPHLVEPYESPEFQPLYATLTDAGGFDRENNSGFDKEDNPGFRWSSALSYMEAK